jgi:hypothetical protein
MGLYVKKSSVIAVARRVFKHHKKAHIRDDFLRICEPVVRKTRGVLGASTASTHNHDIVYLYVIFHFKRCTEQTLLLHVSTSY